MLLRTFSARGISARIFFPSQEFINNPARPSRIPTRFMVVQLFSHRCCEPSSCRRSKSSAWSLLPDTFKRVTSHSSRSQPGHLYKLQNPPQIVAVQQNQYHPIGNNPDNNF